MTKRKRCLYINVFSGTEKLLSQTIIFVTKFQMLFSNTVKCLNASHSNLVVGCTDFVIILWFWLIFILFHLFLFTFCFVLFFRLEESRLAGSSRTLRASRESLQSGLTYNARRGSNASVYDGTNIFLCLPFFA